jgi:hypothetical protein
MVELTWRLAERFALATTYAAGKEEPMKRSPVNKMLTGLSGFMTAVAILFSH